MTSSQPLTEKTAENTKLTTSELARINTEKTGINYTDTNAPASDSIAAEASSFLRKNLPQGILKQSGVLKFDPKLNRLLAALPSSELDFLSSYLKLIYLPLGESLYVPGIPLTHAYFPINCVVSMHYVTETSASTETASAGNEGMVGIALVMGGDSTPSSSTVVIAGYAYKIEGHLLKRALTQNDALQRLLWRYIQVLITQISQTAVCNRHHTIEQQLSRWLLLNVSRLSTNELTITQELVASILGVRRESITQAASNLQRAGLISYRRGHISLLDRHGLEKWACECHKVMQTELKRLLHDAD
ncbi:MAG: Crp/Fnr family transcriptional regulator [Pseudomonadota bacterium]